MTIERAGEGQIDPPQSVDQKRFFEIGVDYLQFLRLRNITNPWKLSDSEHTVYGRMPYHPIKGYTQWIKQNRLTAEGNRLDLWVRGEALPQGAPGVILVYVQNYLKDAEETLTVGLLTNGDGHNRDEREVMFHRVENTNDRQEMSFTGADPSLQLLLNTPEFRAIDRLGLLKVRETDNPPPQKTILSLPKSVTAYGLYNVKSDLYLNSTLPVAGETKIIDPFEKAREYLTTLITSSVLSEETFPYPKGAVTYSPRL